MESRIEITEYRAEKGRLRLAAKGFLAGAVPGKVRLTAIFSNGEQERRFPLKGETYFSEEAGGAFFFGEGSPSLQDVFYVRPWESLSEPETRVTVEASALDEALLRDLALSAEARPLPVALFRKGEGKRSPAFLAYRIVALLACVLLLPLFLLDGAFALRGYKRLDTGINEAGGLRGVFLHANELTKRICGFSYSPREAKTQYLRRQYERACARPVERKSVLLLSERPLEENGNLALVRDALLSRKGEGIVVTEFLHAEPIHKLSFRKIRESARKMAAAECILLEDFYPQLHALSVRRETKVVQLWHACGAFKTFGFSRLGRKGGPEEDSGNHRCYDYAMVSSRKMRPIYGEAFGIPESHVLAMGVPRTDIFFREGYREEARERLYAKYPGLRGKKVVLFAPTFRGDGNKTADYPTERVDWDFFFQRVPEDWAVVARNHPFVRRPYRCGERWQGRLWDLSGKDSVNDLLFLADLLVTDYSSCVFEAALLRVPMVFYVFDREEYLADRDLYYDLDALLPGGQARDMEGLVELALQAMPGEGGDEGAESQGRTRDRAQDGKGQRGDEPDGGWAMAQDRAERERRYQWFLEEFLDALSGSGTDDIADFIASEVLGEGRGTPNGGEKEAAEGRHRDGDV